MKELYDLTFYSCPNGAHREWYGIGLFTTRQEAQAVAEEYLAKVPGFRDYYCEWAVTPVPVIGEPGEEVWRCIGWNEDEEGDEFDIIEGECYPSREEAENAWAHSRQHLAVNRWVIGQRDWQEGFVRENAPTLREVRALLEAGTLTRVWFWYEENYFYFFPRRVSDALFLGAEEDDFILDGFTIRRLRDVKRIEHKEDKCLDILKAEGIVDSLTTPEVDVTSWQTVFSSLEKLGKNIIIEEAEEERFSVGRIESVEADRVLLRHFDADGIWQEEPWEIGFEDITAVTFGSRYVEVFSKYVGEPGGESR